MKFLTLSYQLIQNLSFDVVVGAMAMAFLFSKVCSVVLPFGVYSVLGISVWLIYTFDHLLDAKKIIGLAKTRRHRFHQLHYDVLVNCWLVLFVLGLLLSISWIPLVTWYLGLGIVFFSIVHFVLVYFFGSSNSKLLFKEVGVAWGYSTGIVIGSFSQLDKLGFDDILSFGLLFLVVLFNLVMFSYFDFYKDKKNMQASIAVNYGVKKTRYILYCLFVVISVVSFLGVVLVDSSNWYYYFSVYFLFSVGLFYFLMVVLLEHGDNSDFFRKIGDAVFLLPLVLMFF